MVWTGHKRSLLELIYAVNQTSCINDGEVPLKDLVGFFSEVFHVELPDFHSVINRMKERHPRRPIEHSRAFFLEDLLARFEQKLEDLDD